MKYPDGEGPSNQKASKGRAKLVKGKPTDDKRDKADKMDVREEA